MVELHFVELAVGGVFYPTIGFYGEIGISHCGYDAGCWQSLMQSLEADDFPYRRTHDAVLSATLLGHGVRTFYTRNLKDFRDAGFERIIDPLGAM